MDKILNDDLSCPVCRETLINPVTIPCGHAVCAACADTLIQVSRIKTPVIREAIAKSRQDFEAFEVRIYHY